MTPLDIHMQQMILNLLLNGSGVAIVACVGVVDNPPPSDTASSLSLSLSLSFTHTHTHTHTLFPLLLSLPPSLQRKNPKGEYQVQRQDPEELAAVCQVVEDLIQMQTSLFTVSVVFTGVCVCVCVCGAHQAPAIII